MNPIEITQQYKSTASPVRKWLHNNPIIQKTTVCALSLIGIKIFYEGIKNYSLETTSMAAIMLGGSYLLQKFGSVFIPPSHNPSNRVFKIGSCKDVYLDYHGDLPILTITKDVSPNSAGYARGYLMASQIKDMLEKNKIAFHKICGLPSKIPNIIEKIKAAIPAEYLEEMNGIVEGYNAKRGEWKFLKGEELVLEDLIYFHLLPELGHLDFNTVENRLEDLGCTVVVDGDTHSGPQAIRTVDWIAMDVYGKYSFIEFRETASGYRYAGQSFPLFIGCLTAMNEEGLCVALNVARGSTDSFDKMPAVFYLRKIIEECKTVKNEDAAEAFIQNLTPLGSFNLTLLDKKNAASIHFYQDSNNQTYRRDWRGDQRLVTLNFMYDENGESNPTFSNSIERKGEIVNYYIDLEKKENAQNLSPSDRVKGVLLGPEVNNIRTISAAWLDPRNRIFQIAFDNGYAADQILQNVPVQSWFSDR